MKRQVSLNNSSFERAGITKDCQDAVCEYIWNGFEAGASKVCVSIQGKELQDAMTLVISDNGSGINYDSWDETFGTFLSSVKNNDTIRIKSQSNKGKGRFSYLSFSPTAEWTTVYKDGEQLKEYTITTSSDDKSWFDTSEPLLTLLSEETGTSVSFPLFDSYTKNQLSFPAMQQKLLEEFAWYLYLNSGKKYTLEYLGTTLDISIYINEDQSTTSNITIGDVKFKIDIVVWKNNVSNSSKIYYLSEKGEIVHVENTSFNKNKVGFYHAVFVSSSFFKPNMIFPGERSDDPPLFHESITDEQRSIMRTLKQTISTQVHNVLKQFLISQAETKLDEMERRGSFPLFDNDEYGELKKRDFQIVTKELYCVEPRIFYKLSDMQERSLLGLLNLLLSSDERENVLQIVEQIVNLTSEQRKNFAKVLQRSQLQYIIDVISIIERRVAVVEELKRIVFDGLTFANERKHIQKLIEQHFWLFGEQYHLLTADKNLTTSLHKFEQITKYSDPNGSLAMSDKEGRQRIDIFLYSQRIQEDSSSEMLIIELKAPHVKLSLDVFNQIVRYANTLRKEPRFTSPNRVWRFFTVCSEVEDDVKVKYHNFEQHGKKGLADIIGNFELYALSWDDVFQAFEARHSFMLEKLHLDYSQVVAELNLNKEDLKSRNSVTEETKQLLSINAS